MDRRAAEIVRRGKDQVGPALTNSNLNSMIVSVKGDVSAELNGCSRGSQ